MSAFQTQIECGLRWRCIQEAVSRGIKKVGVEHASPVLLGPVTWVHLARHSNPQASDEETVALKKEYLDAILPIYKVGLGEGRGGLTS